MKNNLIRKIIKNGSVEEALLIIANANETELEEVAEQLDGNEVAQIGEWIFQNINNLGVQSALWIGGMFTLYRLATDKEGRRELLQERAKELGLSDTKVSDSERIFSRFGEPLLEEPQLMHKFPVESLKQLSAKKAPLAARKAAIQLAREGIYVSTEQAKALLREHAATDEQESDVVASQNKGTTKPCGSAPLNQSEVSTKTLWSYESGNGERLTIKADQSATLSEVSIEDILEAALDQYRREHDQVVSDSSQAVPV